MKVVKLLERKEVIQLFGAALLVSPIFNTIMSIATAAKGQNRWSMEVFFRILSTETLAIKFLYVLGFFISLVMLSGRSWAWKGVLFLLGGHILNQVTNLGQMVRANWFYGLFFVINVAAFIFIADQLAFKQRREKTKSEDPPPPKPSLTVAPKSEPVTTPKPITTPTPIMAPAPTPVAATPTPQPEPRQPLILKGNKKTLVHFKGFGTWARLMSLSTTGLHVHCFAQPPFDMGTRIIEIKIKNGPTLYTRLSHQQDRDFYFEFFKLSADEKRQLNVWLKQQAAA